MPAVKDVGEPCAGEPHARIEVAAGGNRNQSATAARNWAPPADPTASQTNASLEGRRGRARCACRRGRRRRSAVATLRLRRRTRPLASASARPRGSCAGLAERPALDLVGLPVELDTERARVASAELLDEPAGRPAPRAPAVSAEVIRAWARDPTGPTVGRACALPGPACPAGGAGSRRRARRGSSAPPSPGRRRAPAAPPARARRRGRPRRSR